MKDKARRMRFASIVVISPIQSIICDHVVEAVSMGMTAYVPLAVEMCSEKIK